jgi:hypothetical protein
MQIMVLSQKHTPRRSGLLSWLTLLVLGLTASVGGTFLPQGVSESEAAPVTTPAAEPVAAAADPLDYAPPDLPELPPPQAIFVRLGIGIGVVLVLCVLALWIGKRWSGPPALPVSENKYLRVLEALPLGGHCSVSCFRWVILGFWRAWIAPDSKRCCLSLPRSTVLWPIWTT